MGKMNCPVPSDLHGAGIVIEGIQMSANEINTTISRRAVLGVIAAAAGVSGMGFYSATSMPFEGSELSPEEAHEKAVAGDIVLIDIRRPDEWAKTGVGKGANPLDMRRDDFIAELDVIVDGKRDHPVALICARGVRSNRMSQMLEAAGFTRIIDVPEGMLGSRAGPGWLNRGLPVAQP